MTRQSRMVGVYYDDPDAVEVDDLRSALEIMLHHGIRAVPVVDDSRRLLALLDEKSVARAYVRRPASVPPVQR